MTERDFWLTIRRALLMLADAIDKRYPAEKTPRSR